MANNYESGSGACNTPNTKMDLRSIVGTVLITMAKVVMRPPAPHQAEGMIRQLFSRCLAVLVVLESRAPNYSVLAMCFAC